MLNLTEMIDELGIFNEVKEVCKGMYPELNIYAFGSRARGESKTGKWDFDVAIGDTRMEILREVSIALKKHFEGRQNEFGKPVRIDVFRTKAKNIKEIQKNISYAVLL